MLLQKVSNCTLFSRIWSKTLNGELTVLPHTLWLLKLLTKFLQIISKKIIQTLMNTRVMLTLLWCFLFNFEHILLLVLLFLKFDLVNACWKFYWYMLIKLFYSGGMEAPMNPPIKVDDPHGAGPHLKMTPNWKPNSPSLKSKVPFQEMILRNESWKIGNCH